MFRFLFRLILLTGIIFFLVFSFLPKNLNEYFIQPLVAEIETSEDFQLGIVLGAGMKIGGRLTDLATERVEYAVSIFNDTNIPLMFSGGKTDYGIESVAMNEYAQELGYDEDGILEEKSTSTYENAKFSDRILDEENVEIESVLLFTSSFHSKRALAVFEKVMPERKIYVAYPQEQALLNDSFRGRWSGLFMIVREYAAIGVYKVRFGI